MHTILDCVFCGLEDHILCKQGQKSNFFNGNTKNSKSKYSSLGAKPIFLLVELEVEGLSLDMAENSMQT